MTGVRRVLLVIVGLSTVVLLSHIGPLFVGEYNNRGRYSEDVASSKCLLIMQLSTLPPSLSCQTIDYNQEFIILYTLAIIYGQTVLPPPHKLSLLLPGVYVHEGILALVLCFKVNWVEIWSKLM